MTDLRHIGTTTALLLTLLVTEGTAAAKPPVVRESATSLAVVVHPRSKLDSLALSDAAALFVGEDTRATIIVLQPAESSAHWALLGSVLDMSAGQMDRALLQRRYQDELNAEVRTVATSKDVRAVVAKEPGAIGYLWDEEVDDSVKVVLRVPMKEALPAEQGRLLAETLRHDTKLVTPGVAEPVRVAVLFRTGHTVSEADTQAFTAAFEEAAKAGGKLAVKVARIGLPPPGGSSLEAALAELKPSVIFVGPALREMLPEVEALARRRSILTATGTESYARDGLSVAIVARKKKAKVMVDSASTRAEGHAWDSSLNAETR